MLIPQGTTGTQAKEVPSDHEDEDEADTLIDSSNLDTDILQDDIRLWEEGFKQR